MQELTPSNVQHILSASKKFLRNLQTFPILQDIAKRLPTATATALRMLALYLKQQGQDITPQSLKTPLKTMMTTSFIDGRIFEVAARARPPINVKSILEQVVNFCVKEIFTASGKELNKVLLFLDFSITLLQLPKPYQQALR